MVQNLWIGSSNASGSDYFIDLNIGHWPDLLVNYFQIISNISKLLPVFKTSNFPNDYAEINTKQPLDKSN